MTVELTSGAIATLREEAARAHPLECCGILLGSDQKITIAQPCANVHPQPDTRFEIDPQALIAAHRAARAGGEQVVGYFHSHPNGSAEPSATDRALASGDGRIWAIVTAAEISCWRDRPDGFERLPYIVIDD